MRTIGLYLLLCIGLLSCKKETATAFNIKGHIENIPDSMDIFISYPVMKDGVWVDSTQTTTVSADGNFSFSGNLEGLTNVFVGWKPNKWVSNGILVLLESEDIELNIDNNEPYLYNISGAKTTFRNLKGFENLLSNDKQINDTRAGLIKLVDFLNENTEKGTQRDSVSAILDTIIRVRERLFEERVNIYLSLIKANQDSKISPILLYNAANSDYCSLSRDSIELIFNDLPKSSQKSLMGSLMKKKIESMPPYMVQNEGDLAIDFVREDVNGNLIKLHDYKSSKYVLLDFWASWCRPCIAGLPTIASLCDEYKQEDLIIIGISCDEDTPEWKDAILQYNLNKWIQIKSRSNDVVDNAIFNEDISDWYNVDGIPTYFFINKEGIVLKIWHHIGKNELEYISQQVKKK